MNNEKQAMFEEHKRLYAEYFEYIKDVNEANGTDYVVEAQP